MPEEGIYFFGGRDQDGKASNQLWLLKIFQSPFEFELVQPSTPLPKARYGHCLEHIEGSPYLVTFGGRNDHFFKIFSYKSCFFEVDIFDIENKSWYKVKTGTYRPESRFGFCFGSLGSKLYIFGGLGDNNYISPTMERLELDQQKVEEIIYTEDKKRKPKKGSEVDEPAPPVATNMKIGLKLSTGKPDNTESNSPIKAGSDLDKGSDLEKGKNFEFGFNGGSIALKASKLPDQSGEVGGTKATLIKLGGTASQPVIEPKQEHQSKAARSYQPIPLTREGLRRYVRGVEHLPLK
jgi:hypothetical protein